MTPPSADSGSLIQTRLCSSAFLRRVISSSSSSITLLKWGHVSTLPALGVPYLFKNELAWDPYHPHMPFKVHHYPAHIVIEFTNIVVALRLIAAFVLWVWLYVIALLLSHYNGPLFFD